jgi:photosystem II stability/assembly factor-like uncharacterized protein
VTYGGSINGGCAFALDPVDPDNLYLSVSHQQGILKSEDAGANWRLVEVDPDDYCFGGLLVNPYDARKVYACSDGNLVMSQDWGDTWGEAQRMPECTGMAGHPASGEIMYVSTWGAGLVRSSDGGSSWERVGPQTSGFAVYDIDVTVGPPVSVYVATSEGIFVAQDAGK